MKIVHKYLTREILKFFFIIMAMVVSVYFIVDFFEKIDNFMEADAPMDKALLFFLYNIPFIVSQVLPVAILLAILVTFGLMSKNNEIVALRSSGVSTLFLFQPLVAIGVAGTMILFLLSEVIVPITMEKANRIYLTEVKKVSTMKSKKKGVWIKGDQSVYHISYYDSADQRIFGLSAYFFNDQFKLIKRIDADRGRFENDQWILDNVMIQQIDAETGDATVSLYHQQTTSANFLPEDLNRIAKSSKEMGFVELLSFIHKVESDGYNADKYRVDLNAKIAFPVACVIMCLVGTGIAVRGKLKEGIPVIIAYGLGIAFLYWVVFSFFISLGYGNMLHPIPAAWMANLLFLGVGSLAVLKSN